MRPGSPDDSILEAIFTLINSMKMILRITNGLFKDFLRCRQKDNNAAQSGQQLQPQPNLQNDECKCKGYMNGPKKMMLIILGQSN
jgi:hypothetical protein